MASNPMHTLHIDLPGLDETYAFLRNDTTLSVPGRAADAKVTGDALAAVQAQVDGVQAGQELGAGQILTTTGTVNPTPYTYRANMSGSDRVTISQITGGTVAWNQLVGTATTSVTVASGHKYVALVGGTWSVGTSDGTALTVTGGTDMVFDLTQMFGATVAQHFLDLETATAGAGVALFRTMFPESYYPYNTGELVSVQASGRKSGDHTYPLDSTLTLRGVPVLTDGQVAYDGDKYAPDGTVTRRYGIVDLGTLTWSIYQSTEGVFRAAISDYSISSMGDAPDFICGSAKYTPINTTNSAGIFAAEDKIILHQYNSSAIVIKDSEYGSDYSALASSLSGVYLVYELATPTAETAAPYQEVQIAGSTEEFLPPATDTRAAAVPVGSVSLYQTNLREGLETLLNPDVSLTGASLTIAAEKDKHYICADALTELSFTPCATGICSVRFTAGSAMVLTVPSTVKWPVWFNPSSLTAGTTYELNVLDGVYGVVGAWT